VFWCLANFGSTSDKLKGVDAEGSAVVPRNLTEYTNETTKELKTVRLRARISEAGDSLMRQLAERLG
jgi:hypothetical protein